MNVTFDLSRTTDESEVSRFQLKIGEPIVSKGKPELAPKDLLTTLFGEPGELPELAAEIVVSVTLNDVLKHEDAVNRLMPPSKEEIDGLVEDWSVPEGSSDASKRKLIRDALLGTEHQLHGIPEEWAKAVQRERMNVVIADDREAEGAGVPRKDSSLQRHYFSLQQIGRLRNEGGPFYLFDQWGKRKYTAAGSAATSKNGRDPLYVCCMRPPPSVEMDGLLVAFPVTVLERAWRLQYKYTAKLRPFHESVSLP